VSLGRAQAITRLIDTQSGVLRRGRSLSPDVLSRSMPIIAEPTPRRLQTALRQTLQMQAARDHGVTPLAADARAVLSDVTGGGDAAVDVDDVRGTPRASHVAPSLSQSMFSASPYRYTPAHPSLSTGSPAPSGSGTRSELYAPGLAASQAALSFFAPGDGADDSDTESVLEGNAASMFGRTPPTVVSRPRLNSSPLRQPRGRPPEVTLSPLHRSPALGPLAPKLLGSPSRSPMSAPVGLTPPSMGFSMGIAIGPSPRVPGLSLPSLGSGGGGGGGSGGGGLGLGVPMSLVVQGATPRLHVPKALVIAVTPRPPDREQRPTGEDDDA
jgi:hypothetical protein